MSRLRGSGLAGMAVFALMAVSDVLMLTTLPCDWWFGATRLPAQVAFGYYLGELTIPFYVVIGWHISLGVQPANAAVARLVLGATAYTTPLFAVWHAAFPLVGYAARADPHPAPLPSADLAFATYAVPLFRIGIALAAGAFLVAGAFILRGGTHYPRGAALVLPAAFGLVAFVLPAILPAGPLRWMMSAARWNVAGAVTLALSTAYLWRAGASAPRA